ncbi:MAG: outer membrane lipoprotein carrier protein LolA [Hyphomonadaceae bacterium]|nr:outer membrane lipoprotein carrier protein LolA [Hyphomonadaceae bacterium]
MLVGMVSTIALVLAFGPQLQVSPTDPDRSVPQKELLKDAIEEEVSEIEEVIIDTPAPAPSEPDNEVDADIESDAMTDGSNEVTDAAPIESEPAPLEPMDAVETEVIETAPDIDTPSVDTAPAAETATPRRGDVPEAEWPNVIGSASSALAAAKTARGKFIQTNADGSVVTGSFALNRPGRMRFDYDDPTPVLIVSDGTTVAMEDSELETVDRVPIGATPLGLILATELDVDNDVEVLSVLENEERIGIRVQDASGELDGTLTMVFDKTSYDLLGWLAVDGNLQTTVVDLLDVETNIRIDPRLFRLDEDEDEEDER